MTDPGDLGTIELFAGLDERALARAVQGLEAVTLHPRDEFDFFGEARATCCVVGAGRLALAVLIGDAGDHGERTIGMLERGDVVVRPLDGVISSGPRVRCFAIEESLLHLVRPGAHGGLAARPCARGEPGARAE